MLNKKILTAGALLIAVSSFGFGYFLYSKPVLAATTVTPLVPTTQIYADIEGAKQGKFLGDSTNAKWKNSIEISGLSYDVTSPRDAATGQATGKRQYQPLVITKNISKNSPQFFQAAASNEVLKNITFSFVSTDSKGLQTTYYTIALQNATISDYQNIAGDAITDNKQPDPREQISFTFQKITVTSVDGKTTASDNWQAAQ
jgi:type VI secretion system secreted protein Hcp